ncbi:DeoR/GlpR family DNA-binding transcription regulator [Paenibacillus alginolyticus]|uniref:DeoR/GlpR family DNA-binding transcription regulator n=1 Tax=Paenibacillus alginolyticus TaxID=59839 RepID=A0ABT4GMJ5_9BACL|nr:MULTISPECIES: DeoR/GlpR family DNA-binding transcription regulator [Paenibacillus]MCY9669190.1 DeoR/GlpR family DNA-binding transcription regulator [Paenibacillus alginolyticus]MCY9697441.1 DeoR/GlpR family DNA-binding transcription regulator [Paenibacillus alginolyticus]MEC0148474.1 DeoR/GlpR family DNA-binding transcription regulator [Paenibacillus alginolyticus]NRF95378.1 DeoR/GlpR transcriptional regulator [Paenibacillus frigoriresistens]
MIVAERYQHILRLVNEKGSIRVTELSQLCKVTEETIRRDLGRLESEGRLMRSYGGAMRIQPQTTETSYQLREAIHVTEKQRISAEAVKYVAPNDRIVLDASTTAWHMASHLPDIPLTVLTNSLKVTFVLSEKKNVTVINTGGILVSNSLSFLGPLAEQALEEYHVNKAFISCKGVHMERGISESNELQARIKRKMVGMAEEVYLLADYSKFDVQAFTMISGWNQIHHLITDAQTPAEYTQMLQRKFINVIQLPEQ